MRRMKREGGINVVNFGRLLTAMVTPFTAEGEVDYQGASKLALRLVENGSDGLVIAGTTGNHLPSVQKRRSGSSQRLWRLWVVRPL